LIGPFAIERAGGMNVALYGKRAKALLALLALAPNGTRSRKWLQSKLWSTRGEEQGAASLRQELFELRKSLRNAGLEVLTADRELVQLDLKSIDLDYSNDRSRSASTDDLLEGLDIRDPEFEEWLREQRSKWRRLLAEQSSAPTRSTAGEPNNHLAASRPCIGLVFDTQPNDVAGAVVGNLVLDLVARSVLNFEVVDLVDFRVPSTTLRAPSEKALPEWLLQAKTSVLGSNVCVSISLLAPGDNQLLWTHTEFLDLADVGASENLRLMAFTNNAVFAVLDLVLNPRFIRTDCRHRASRLAFTAIRQVLGMPDADVDAAERMLAEAYALDPKSTYLGWLLFVFCTRLGESWVRRSPEFHDQVREHARRAIETDSFNPITLALTAHTYSFFFHEYPYALELLDRAVTINPAQSICWDLRALTLGYLGDVELGYKDAMRARALCGPPPYRYLIDTTCCILSTLNGRFEEGIEHGKRVLAQQPNYMPALRYTAACYGHLGQWAEAARTVDFLRKREPNFSAEKISDQDYPIAGVLGVSIIQSGLSQIALPGYAAPAAA
jgi:tetratricopeptide (TPR) repeat protein